MSERMVRVGEVELCLETFGSPVDPTVLLVHGSCASMLWWPRELCEGLAARGRHVVRYDSRDTGRSTSFPVGAPPYGLRDLAADAIGLLDALGVATAHVVGRSTGGAVALVAALDHPGRVASLTLVGCTTGEEGLPPMTPAFLEGCTPDDPDDPVEVIVALVRAYGGTSPHVDEAAIRAVAVADVARTVALDAALTNHLVMSVDGPRHGGPGDVRVPTLVVHGDVDPVFPLAHGRALADAVPGAQLMVLEDTGHDVPAVHVPAVVDAVVALTAPA